MNEDNKEDTTNPSSPPDAALTIGDPALWGGSLGPAERGYAIGGKQYAGDPTKWPALPRSDGTEYAGDPTNFPATITLPSGRQYAGDPTKWPATIELAGADIVLAISQADET